LFPSILNSCPSLLGGDLALNHYKNKRIYLFTLTSERTPENLQLMDIIFL
jgi:hypothetical protein